MLGEIACSHVITILGTLSQSCTSYTASKLMLSLLRMRLPLWTRLLCTSVVPIYLVVVIDHHYHNLQTTALFFM